MLGVFSLTTAQLVAELALDVGPQMGREVRLLRAEAFRLTRQHGVATARGEDGEEVEAVEPGLPLLAVALAAPRSCVSVLEVRAGGRDAGRRVVHCTCQLASVQESVLWSDPFACTLKKGRRFGF